MKRNLKFEDVPGPDKIETLKEKLAKIGIGSVRAGQDAAGTNEKKDIVSRIFKKK